jgi:MerR family transcriptional regulator, heat shock protein HspR
MEEVQFTIEQVAQMVGVTKGTLRYWETVFTVTPGRNHGNHRRYTQPQIDVMKKIRDLYAQGYAVKGVKAHLGLDYGAN